MNLILRNLHILVIAMIGVIPATMAPAQTAPKMPVTGILDMRVILRDSHVGKAWQAYFESKRKAHKDAIAVEEKKLRTAWDELNRQRSVMAPQAFQARERAFREMEAAAKGKIGQLEQSMNASLRATLSEVRKTMDGKLGTILDGLVQEKKIDLILSNQDIVYFRKELDITQEVLKRFDKALPSIDIPALAAKAKP